MSVNPAQPNYPLASLYVGKLKTLKFKYVKKNV